MRHLVLILLSACYLPVDSPEALQAVLVDDVDPPDAGSPPDAAIAPDAPEEPVDETTCTDPDEVCPGADVPFCVRYHLDDFNWAENVCALNEDAIPTAGGRPGCGPCGPDENVE